MAGIPWLFPFLPLNIPRAGAFVSQGCPSLAHSFSACELFIPPELFEGVGVNTHLQPTSPGNRTFPLMMTVW